MRVRLLLVHLALFLLGASLQPLCSAQQDTAGKDPDSLFVHARDLASAGKYKEARTVLSSILASAPFYHDAAILMARTYAWEQNPDSARAILTRVLQKAPNVLDAHIARVDVELWSGRYKDAEHASQTALQRFPRSDELLTRKARALAGLGRKNEARILLRDILLRHPDDESLRSLLAESQDASAMQGIGIVYGLDSYAHYFGPMHTGTVSYEHGTAAGPVSVQLTGSERFGLRGIQFGGDWYPRFTPAWYGFISYAYSGSVLFPNHRIGAECTGRLVQGWEASVGMRAFLFDAHSTVWLGTASVTAYTGAWYFSLRPYLTVRGSESAGSGVLMVRRYLAGSNDYLAARVGAGFSADERFLQSSAGLSGTEIYFLASQFAGIGVRKTIGPHLALNMTVDYLRQELGFLPGKYVSALSLSTGISLRW